MVNVKQFLDAGYVCNHPYVRNTILSELRNYFPKKELSGFKEKFIDGVMQAPMSNSKFLRVKWSSETNKYDAENLHRTWIKNHPEVCNNLKQFIDDVNQIKNLDPLSIHTYGNQIDKWFKVISLSLLAFAMVQTFIISFFVTDPKFGQKFWPIFIFVWQFVTVHVKKLVKKIFFYKAEKIYTERQGEIYILKHSYNNNFFFENHFNLVIGTTSSYFTLRSTKKGEDVVKVVKQMTIVDNGENEQDPYNHHSSDTGGSFFIEDSSEEENVAPTDNTSSQSLNMLPWFCKKIIGFKKCKRKQKKEDKPDKNQILDNNVEKVTIEDGTKKGKPGVFEEDKYQNQTTINANPSQINRKKNKD